jgi:hypothetical protein
LRAVLAIRSSPKVLFSLAQAEEQLGQFASAQADYARSLEGAAIEGKGDVVQAAEVAQRGLAARVPHVRVVLSGGEPGRAPATAGVSATLDDQPMTVGAAVPVDPGEHRVVVSAPGMRIATADVKIAEAQQLDVPVALEPDRDRGASPAVAVAPAPAPAPVALPPPPPPNRATGSEAASSSAWRTAAFVTGGAGIIALGVGAVFGLQSMSKHDEAEKACPGAICMGADGSALWHDAVTSGNAATIAFVLGGLGVAGGAVLWLAAPKSNYGGARVGLRAGPNSLELRGAW